MASSWPLVASRSDVIRIWPGRAGSGPRLNARLSPAKSEPSLPPPGLGEHNEYVYREILGVSAEEYERLIAEGEIGTEYAPGAG